MSLNELIKEYRTKLDKGMLSEKILNWLEEIIKKNSDNIDARYLHIQVLNDAGLDKQREKAELELECVCSTFIKKNKKQSSQKVLLQVAKAYLYLGMYKNYAIDRLKCNSEAKNIINILSPNEIDKKHLLYFSKYIDENPNRGILFYITENGYYIFD